MQNSGHLRLKGSKAGRSRSFAYRSGEVVQKKVVSHAAKHNDFALDKQMEVGGGRKGQEQEGLGSGKPT